jgi:anti-sigma regulatory factor (Ser/Thr protein kinase)
MTESVSLKMTLPRVPDIELVALAGLDHLAHHLGIAEESIGEAKLVVTEAIINGLEHTGDDAAAVNVEFTMTTRELVVLVRDFGKGFDPSAVEDPDIDKKLGSGDRRGWGLKVMRSLSDDFKIESGATGTKITIKKLIS